MYFHLAFLREKNYIKIKLSLCIFRGAKMALILQDILANLHAAEQDCARYEKQYGMLSEHFYELYRNGTLDNDHPNFDYTDWAGAYKIMLQSKKDYFNSTIPT